MQGSRVRSPARDGFVPSALQRVQRKNYLLGAGVLLILVALHCVVARAISWQLVGFQVGVALGLSLLGMALGVGRVPGRVAGVASGLLGLLALMGFVHHSGGPHSPYFHVFVGLPFLLAMFSPDSQLPVLVGGAASLGAAVAVNLMGRMPVDYIALGLLSQSSFMVFALLSTHVYRRMLEAHQTAHQERLAALAQLAESEQRRRLAECERAEMARLVLVEQLAAGVAHEVNNPLAYVKANLNHLLREGRSVDPGELMDVLAETQQGVLRIQQIITDLRGFAREGSLQDDPRGLLGEALGEATRLVSMRLRDAGDITLALEPGLPAVRLGQRHIVQVSLNLLLNAVDAVEMARPGLPVRVSVRAWRVEGGVRLEMDDNGPGIAPDVLPRIFEPFFTTKPPGKGAGLGLALCREYVSRVGGSLHAENPPGGGARFVLLLPVAREALPERV